MHHSSALCMRWAVRCDQWARSITPWRFLSSCATPARTVMCEGEEFLKDLVNHEARGVPEGAGTAGDKGFDLHRMARLVERLGSPISNYKVVHIAGSKGKGSVAAFCSNILREAGYRTAQYTSPHIRHIRERICGPDGAPIAQRAFRSLLDRHLAALRAAQAEEGGALTHFEVLTALAFAHFAEVGVDVAVVEAGLGGARDATNVIPTESLAAAVITSIGMEHAAALGGTLESIARAKAGILKASMPVVLAQQAEPRAEREILAAARSLRAPVWRAAPPSVTWRRRGLRLEEGGGVLRDICSFQFAAGEGLPGADGEQLRDVRLGMPGAHQAANAAAALQVARCLSQQGFHIPGAAMREGLQAARLPGRFQVLPPSGAALAGAGQALVVLDGAHTEASGTALATTLHEAFGDLILALVVAMASDKDHVAFARSLLSGGIRPEVVILTQVSIAESAHRSADTSSLLQAFSAVNSKHSFQTKDLAARSEGQEHGESGCNPSSGRVREDKVKLLLASDIREAIGRAQDAILGHTEEGKGLICVTGSLHAVRAVLDLVEGRQS